MATVFRCGRADSRNRNRILKLPGLQPVGEVWGVGRRLTEKLNALGINTALQLAQANTAFIRKNFSVILERTVRELNGESCISPKKHHRQNSRLSVVAVLVNESQTKMPCTGLLFSMQSGPQRNYVGASVLPAGDDICTDIPFAVKEPCYSNAAVEKLPLPTQDSRDIIAAACRALKPCLA